MCDSAPHSGSIFRQNIKLDYTLIEIFIFCPKNQLWFSKKIIKNFLWKTRENVVVLDFLGVDNFNFTRKIVKKILVKKFVKNWFFGQKFDFSNSVLKKEKKKMSQDWQVEMQSIMQTLHFITFFNAFKKWQWGKKMISMENSELLF